MIAMMEKYTNNLEEVVAERTEQLQEEKRKTDELLFRMLPRYKNKAVVIDFQCTNTLHLHTKKLLTPHPRVLVDFFSFEIKNNWMLDFTYDKHISDIAEVFYGSSTLGREEELSKPARANCVSI